MELETTKTIRSSESNLGQCENRGAANQTGDCYTDIGYKTFDFKVFDGSQSICTNLDSFRSNAGIFFGNFVCNPKEEYLNWTFYKWHKMVSEIETICDPFSGPKRFTSRCFEDC